MTKLFILIFLFTSVTVSFSQIKSVDNESLAEMYSGSYIAKQPSSSDSSFNEVRFDIKRIWRGERTDAQWLYVTVTMMSFEEPYIQRIQKITNTYEGRFQISSYSLTSDILSREEWKKENPLAGLTPDSLTLTDDCSIVVTLMNDNSYEGGNEGIECKGEMPGVSSDVYDIKISQEGIAISEKSYNEPREKNLEDNSENYFFRRIK